METVISHNLLLQLLQQTFGTKVEWIDYKIANQQRDYLVLLVQLRHPSIEVVVKLAGPEASMACSFERTAMLHRLVERYTTIPMPEVIAVNMSFQTWPWRYLIKTHIPGQEWAAVRPQMNVNELSNAYQQIGNVVAQLHTIRFPVFGELAADGSVQGGDSYFTALAERARHSIKSASLCDLFFSVLEKHQALFVDIRHASLCHEDLHKYNILFQHQQGTWRLATILDFDKAWAGHHEIDLARFEFWEGRLRYEFWQSYEAIHPLEPLYRQRRPIYQLLWCFEYAQPTAKHLADTQRLCAELGMPRFDRFD
jgi:aminoglycoside phosphotransferase (APT) family kinase protein